MTENMLKYESVEIRYKDEIIVQDITFSLRKGEILGLVGESGSGKSSLIKAAMGLLGREGKITGGTITYNSNSLVGADEKELRKLRGSKIGMIFQDPAASFCPVRTIGNQIYESLRAHERISKVEAKKRTAVLFDKLNLKDMERIWKSYPFELSGGMNQRVGIAMAMIMNPPVLLADEPTSALDVVARKQVVKEMMELRKLFGTSILIVSHDIGVVSAMADSILVLKEGKIVEYGTREQVLRKPESIYTRELLSAVPHLERNGFGNGFKSKKC